MENKGGNMVRDILIAAGLGILGGVVGGAIWFGLSFLGRLTFLAGIVAGLGGGFGGMITGEKNRAVKLTIAIVFSLGLFCVGMYLGVGVDIYTALHGEYALSICMKMINTVLSSGELNSGFIKDAVIGIICYVVGILSAIVKLKDF